MRKIAFGLAMGLVGLSTSAFAAQTTGTFQVKMQIIDQCVFTTGGLSDIDFGTQGVLTAPLTITTSITVQCTSNTAYNVGLDAGNSSGAPTVTTRKMSGAFASQTVSYSLYRNAGLTQNWGNTPGTDTNGGTGTGAAVVFPLFALVPAQTTPQAGSYVDTITATITY